MVSEDRNNLPRGQVLGHYSLVKSAFSLNGQKSLGTSLPTNPCLVLNRVWDRWGVPLVQRSRGQFCQDVRIPVCYGLNVCVPSQIHLLKP